MSERRPPWYLLTGVLIGFGLGLLYSWLIDPVAYINTSPDTLRPEFKNHYRSLIALAYHSRADLNRARSRLMLLADDRPAFELGAQAQRLLGQGGSQVEARALAQLAAALGSTAQLDEPSAPDFLPSPVESLPAGLEKLPSTTPVPESGKETPTRQPKPTFTPVATFTPGAGVLPPTPGIPFVLREREKVCDPEIPAGWLQLKVIDRNGVPLSAVRVNIAWSEGEEFFFTGLHPRRSPGYADYQMTPGVVYSLRVGEGGELVNDVAVPQCETAQGTTPGGLKLVFSEP